MKAGKLLDNKQVQKKSTEEKRKFLESINLYAVRQSRMSLQRNKRRKSLKKRLARFRMSRPPKRQSLRQRNIPPVELFDFERRVNEKVLRSKRLAPSQYLLLRRKNMNQQKKAEQKRKNLTNSTSALPVEDKKEIPTDNDSPKSLNGSVLKEEKKENEQLISSHSPLLTSSPSPSFYLPINSTSSNDHVSTGQLNSTHVFQTAGAEQKWVHSETKSFMEGMNTSSESVNYLKQEELDASLIFGKLLASYLRRIKPNSQIQAQQEILRVVQSYIE